MRFLLEVVRRKHVIVRRDEGFEEAPGPSCDEAQCPGVRFPKRIRTVYRRKTRPLCDCWRDHPQDHEWSCDQPCSSTHECEHDDGCPTESNAAGHPPIVSKQIEPGAEPRLSRGHPFE